ncbi:Smr/MutS family protein [Alphaproteobacteria bacterium KMM 3653]|uniref:Smr/MutS family protein n=1 Tax=Harenicola maris TaxID=2841044 RepID=A0AAP2CQ13_9RHOB|nr:Smr/MutS family protein [Harenicola maris]
MSRKKPRGLKPDEQGLWEKVAATTTPLSPKPATRTANLLTPKPAKPTRTAEPPAPIPAFRIGQKTKGRESAADLAPTVAEAINQAPVQMDAKAFGKLKRGKLRPEGRIDLHGLSLAEAYPRLQGFILGAAADGRRLVLVITGKGKRRDQGGPIPTRTGVLRHQVPQWLNSAPLAGVVLQVTTAHQSHGGGGAYYVYLRRRR